MKRKPEPKHQWLDLVNVWNEYGYVFDKHRNFVGVKLKKAA